MRFKQIGIQNRVFIKQIHIADNIVGKILQDFLAYQTKTD